MERRAFSLIELVVVLSVIGILVGLLLPAVQSSRAAAQRASCQNTMRQLGVALHNFEAANGRMPPNGRYPATLSWFVEVLPYLEQDSLYQASFAAAQAEGDATLPPHVGFSTPLKALACPADGRLGSTHNYAGKEAAYTSYLGINSVLVPGQRRLAPGLFLNSPGVTLAAVTDGTSGTIAVVERPPPDNFQAGWWYPATPYWGTAGPNVDLIVLGEPRIEVRDGCSVRTAFGPGRLDNICDRLRIWSLHPSGANFLLLDGSVRFMGYGFAAFVPDAATISGGEIIPPTE